VIKLRILFLSSTFIDKKEEADFIYEFVKSFKDKGHRVLVISSHSKGLPKEQFVNGIRVKRFQYLWPDSMQGLTHKAGIAQNLQNSVLVKMQMLPYLFFGALEARKAIKEFKPDIVEAMWAFPQGFIAAFLKKFMGFKLAIHLFGAEVYLAKKYKMAFLVTWPAKNADLITANSRATKKSAVELGIKKKINTVFCGGINTKRFNQKNKGGKVRKKHKLGKEKMILTVGRLVERKGHVYLVRAMPLILKKIPNAKLFIVGSGPLEKEIKSEVKKLGLEKSVVLTGRVATEILPNYYAAADVFCLPAIIDSRGETEGGQGLVVGEAMATGKPVVASAVGGITDAVKHNWNGLLVKEKNEKQLAEAICKVLSDKKLREKLTKNGLRFVKEEASYESGADKFLKLFKKVI